MAKTADRVGDSGPYRALSIALHVAAAVLMARAVAAFALVAAAEVLLQAPFQLLNVAWSYRSIKRGCRAGKDLTLMSAAGTERVPWTNVARVVYTRFDAMAVEPARVAVTYTDAHGIGGQKAIVSSNCSEATAQQKAHRLADRWQQATGLPVSAESEKGLLGL